MSLCRIGLGIDTNVNLAVFQAAFPVSERPSHVKDTVSARPSHVKDTLADSL